MPTQKIALLLYPNCLPAGLFAAQDLLIAANFRSRQHLFEVTLVAQTNAPVGCAHDIALTPSATLTDADFDTVLVPGFWADGITQVITTLDAHKALINAIAKLPKRTHVMSYCTGVSLVAKAGLLRGQCATATWWLSTYLQSQFPKVDWQMQREIVKSGRFDTAAGVHGHLLLAQSLVRNALTPSRYFELKQLMVLARPEPVLPAFQTLDLIEQSEPLLRSLTQIIERTPRGANNIKQLAAALNMSERTLARKVSVASGFSPGAFVRLVKLKQASGELTNTHASVAQIAAQFGFADESSFRRTFSQALGMTPSKFRERFRNSG
jgi:transcriptional regulator GlxA family with amidase domain